VSLMASESLPVRPGTRWRVGALARLTGLTVRTLHHYEAIGLLGPPARTESGHRLYDEAAVQRLYRVCALRSLGVPLDEIRTLVDDGSSVASVLNEHLARVEQRVEELTRLRDRLRRLCRQSDGQVDTAELLRTIEAISLLERHVDTRRRPGGEQVEHDIEPEWRALGDALRACMDAGADPSTGRARDVAVRARELIHEFAGDDPAIIDALAHMRIADPPADLAGWDPPLMAYLDRALRALDMEENEHAE
jgi:DNA-binding transcriptional MerR regulator